MTYGFELLGNAGHALAAGLFVILAVWMAGRREQGRERAAMVAALALTAFWALDAALRGVGHPISSFAETARNLGWLIVMLVLLTRGEGGAVRRPAGILAIYALLGMLLVAQSGVDIVGSQATRRGEDVANILHVSVFLRMMVAIGALLLAHNLYIVAAPEGRARIRLPLGALAAMWTYDLNLYTVAWLRNDQAMELFAMRGLLVALLAPVIWLGLHRADRLTLRLSRTVAFQSLSLVAVGAYLVAMAILSYGFDLVWGDRARLLQVGLIFGTLACTLLLLPSRKVRGWLRVQVEKHFFQHRYDYRAEWMRFAQTIGHHAAGGPALDRRVVKAVADIADCPAGLLLLRSADDGLALEAQWNWPKLAVPPVAMTAGDAAQLERTGWIFDLEGWRDGTAHPNVPCAPPDWMVAERTSWALVPLIHFDRLIGAILLAKPRFDRRPDWEDFDMMRIAGRQAASYISEAQGQRALSEAQRFEEFNRRFAFIMHDIKNLVSQLSLLARNAERHADNPDFRADMVLTLKESVGRMNDLLARLSQHHKGRSDLKPVALRPVAQAVARAKRPQREVLVTGEAPGHALADAARIEQILTHLVQNAIDASPAGAPVTLALGRRSDRLTVEVIDEGCGMSAEFVRSQLFTPFRSDKAGGFGIGAYEARSLAVAMGGRLDVESREGEGSRFTLLLPIAADENRKIERAA